MEGGAKVNARREVVGAWSTEDIAPKVGVAQDSK
jgi:hypothetical protein